MSLFKVNSIFLIKDMEQKSKTVTRTHKTPTQKYEETLIGTVTATKEIFGRIEKILERDGIKRRETEYVVEIYIPDESKAITKNYAESYLMRYARQLYC